MKLATLLLPREDKFTQSLLALSEIARESSAHLKTYIESDNKEQRKQAGDLISGCKDKSKNLLSHITQLLCQTYITPFDREDIQEFAAHLYKITKTIEKVRERLDLHVMASEAGDFSRQVDLICQEGEAMSDMIKALSKGNANKFVIQKTEVLHALEAQGDEVLAELLVSLFSVDRSARDLILRKDVYDMLEKVIDRYRDAAGIAVEIVLKNS